MAYLKHVLFPSSVRVAGQGLKVQRPFDPQLLRNPLLQQSVGPHPDVPRRERKATVQQEEAEVEHDGPGPLQLLPAVRVSQGQDKGPAIAREPLEFCNPDR